MLKGPCYVLADTHLGVASGELERTLVRFLRSLRGVAASLLIDGDLFEFWFEWRTVIPRWHFRVLSALADLRESGLEVILVAGNHDCWGGDVLERDVGIRYLVGDLDDDVAGWKTHVAHGDGLRPVKDRGYRVLRRVVRHPLSVRAFRWIHPDFGTRLARGTSHASRTYRPVDDGEGLRAVAHGYLGAHPDVYLVIFGHSHRAMLERVATGGIYANPGSWLDEPTYLVIDEQSIELRRYEPSAESVLLHRLDRRPQKALAHA